MRNIFSKHPISPADMNPYRAKARKKLRPDPKQKVQIMMGAWVK